MYQKISVIFAPKHIFLHKKTSLLGTHCKNIKKHNLWVLIATAMSTHKLCFLYFFCINNKKILW